jgi:hypothetical protein
MRVLVDSELAAIAGGLFGCDFVTMGEYADIAGSSAGIGTTLGMLITGNVMGGAVGAGLATATATVAVAGYQVGTAISNVVGFCGKDKSGGS